MVSRAELFILVLIAAAAADPAAARIRSADAHEPLPQAAMIAPANPEGPEAPVQVTATPAEIDALAEDADAEAAPLVNPADSIPAAIPATPADPLFIPGTRFPIAVAPATPASVSPPAPPALRPTPQGGGTPPASRPLPVVLNRRPASRRAP